MVSKAVAKYVKGSPQKTRIVVDAIRGRMVGDAMAILGTSPKKYARTVEMVLKSAIANAEHRSEAIDVDQLYVSRAFVDQAPTLKRIRAAAMGRAVRILKRYSHITIELDVKE